MNRTTYNKICVHKITYKIKCGACANTYDGVTEIQWSTYLNEPATRESWRCFCGMRGNFSEVTR